MDGQTVEICGIGWALKQMQEGKQVTRVGWNGKNQFLELQVPDEHSKMTLPYVFITTVQGFRVPWICSQTDLLALDWMIQPVNQMTASVKFGKVIV